MKLEYYARRLAKADICVTHLGVEYQWRINQTGTGVYVGLMRRDRLGKYHWNNGAFDSEGYATRRLCLAAFKRHLEAKP